MPQKLTARNSLAAQPADGDLLHVVDVSDSTDSPEGSSKKITYANLVPDASTSVKGKVELATSGETITGTDTTRAVTPAGAAAAFQPLDSDLTAWAAKTAPSGTVVGTSDSQTLTNKILTLPIFTNGAISFNTPRGFLINGKFTVTDTGSGITVALKTFAGTDPSASDPIYVNHNGTIRTISATLSTTVADGTNFFNAGSTELATKEIDYFVYLLWNTNLVGGAGFEIGWSRIPYGNVISDFSLTSTNEKFFLQVGAAPASTDAVENIGRFAATLSAGAGYTWSVPTYTALNLIQRPIFETRPLSFALTITGSMTVASPVIVLSQYIISGQRCKVDFSFTVTTSAGPGNEIRFVLPFTPPAGSVFNGSAGDATSVAAWGYMGTSTIVYWRRYDSSNWGTGVGRGPSGLIEYGI